MVLDLLKFQDKSKFCQKDIVEVLKFNKEFEKLLKKVKDSAKENYPDGANGFSVTTYSKSTSKFSDEGKVIKFLKRLSIEDEDYMTLKSPADIKKVIPENSHEALSLFIGSRTETKISLKA